LSRLVIRTLSVIIAFTLITALHIVLGEIAPKSLALQRPEATSLFVIKGIELYLAIFRPVVYLLNNLGNYVLILLGLHAGSGEELVHSPEELRFLVSASRKAGLLGETEQDVVERVFRLTEQRVSAFMTPRLDIVWLNVEEPLTKLQQTIIASVYSRFLVCQGSIDNCLGFVGAKEFLASYLAGTMTGKDLRGLLTQPLYLAESMRALNALKIFKNSGSHIAIVVDEYGAIQGLVTLNDILEAIVGDIQTGSEPAEPQAVPYQNGAWLLDGMLSIEEFKTLFNLRKLPEGDGVDYLTVGGLVLTQLGHIPSVTESFECEGLHFEVISLDRHRIEQVLVTPITHYQIRNLDAD
ncbi:MAG: hemolysin family protein, partial [Microcystaceae cyanobacterium]